jgi:hypothetical protein
MTPKLGTVYDFFMMSEYVLRQPWLEESSSTCMRGANPLRFFRGTVSPLSVLLPTGGGDSEYPPVAYSTLVHSAELNDMKSFSPLTDW